MAMRSKMSLTNEFMMPMALLEIQVRVNLLQHLVDVDSIAFLSLSPSLLLSFS